MRAIVVGMRDDPGCAAVVDWVANFAGEAGSEVLLVHAVLTRSVWFIAGMQVDSTTYLEHRRDHFIHARLEPLRRRGVRARLEVDVGDPAEVLIDAAHRARAGMIAIGGPRHSRLHDALVGNGFGSTASKLAHRSDVPIVVMPAVDQRAWTATGS
jgi:nucleotide-binding universal stress UspA family protein